MRMGMIRALTALALLVMNPLLAAESGTENKPGLTVFAAASLTDVLQKIGAEYEKAANVPVKFSFAASSALARQIESGARADVFFSADQEWMDYLDSRRLIDRTTRRDLLGNRLALIAPADTSFAFKLAGGSPLAALLGANGRLATGDPDSVPVGKYAKSALTSLGLWKEVEPRLIRAENVRAALMYVARGEAPLGIVYETDARVEPKVRVVDLFPESSHTPITYPVAATSTAAASSRAFVDYLSKDRAREIFTQAGFRVLDAKAESSKAAQQAFPPRGQISGSTVSALTLALTMR